MVSYNYLGYGVTDENGIAKLEYNSEGQKRDHSYTGVGAGEIDVLASLDNPIVDGSIVSEIYELCDAIAYDTGIQGTANDNMWNDGSSILKRTSEYSYLDGVIWNAIIVKLNNSINLPFTNGMCVELDVLEVTGQTRIVFNDGSNHSYVWGTNDGYSDTGHWKLMLKDGKFKAQCGNDAPFEIGDFNTSVSTFTAKLECYNDFQSFKFKNFRMYSI